jgi:hypothetical protein
MSVSELNAANMRQAVRNLLDTIRYTVGDPILPDEHRQRLSRAMTVAGVHLIETDPATSTEIVKITGCDPQPRIEHCSATTETYAAIRKSTVDLLYYLHTRAYAKTEQLVELVQGTPSEHCEAELMEIAELAREVSEILEAVNDIDVEWLY